MVFFIAVVGMLGTMNVPSASTITKSVVEVVDSIPVDLGDIEVPDLGDVLSDASDFVSDSALVLGATGATAATKGAEAAWRNRSTIATAVVIALAIVGIIALWKRRQDPSTDPDIA